jgi:hypothetical protein
MLMSVRTSQMVLIVSVVVCTSVIARAQGVDVSLPLERIEELPRSETPSAANSAAVILLSAEQAPNRATSSSSLDVELRLGADIDDSEHYGTYLDAAAKYKATADGLVTLVPELTIRGDNLSSAGMGTQGLRTDGVLAAVLAPDVLDKRLRLAFVADGWYMATEGADTRGLVVGAKASIAFCSPVFCHHAGDGEQVRVRTSFGSPSSGSDSVVVEVAYAPQWAYRDVPSRGGPSLARIAATPILSLKNTDMGWATSLGFDVGIDLTARYNAGLQLRHTFQGGAAAEAATQAGLYISYRPRA